MNANALYTNQDYAYHPYKGNAEFLHDAQRVKILRIIKSLDNDSPVAVRAPTWVLVKLLNDDGTQATEFRYGYGTVALPDKQVRARDIMDHWDHYVLERDTRKGTNAIDWSTYAD